MSLTKSTKTRRARGSLNEGEILDAVAVIIERDGINGLSMPILAKFLNAGVMSVYWYFHSKEELLVALADRTLLEVYSRLPPIGDAGWDEDVIKAARGLCEELKKTSLYLKLCRAYPICLSPRPSVIPVLAERLEEELEPFNKAGIDISDAARLVAVLTVYTLGFALMQVTPEAEPGEPVEQAFHDAVDQLSPAKYPMLCAASTPGAAVSVSDEDYDRALRLLVMGMVADVSARPGDVP